MSKLANYNQLLHPKPERWRSVSEVCRLWRPLSGRSRKPDQHRTHGKFLAVGDFTRFYKIFRDFPGTT
jgi:hypothetical protein